MSKENPLITINQIKRMFPNASKSIIEANKNNPIPEIHENKIELNPTVRFRGLSAWRSIGGKHIYARSKIEANYARVLQFKKEQSLIKDFFHEEIVFWFKDIKRGVRSYLPDFTVMLNDGSVEYHEVKGWMDPKSKTKIKRMAKYYPDVKLVVIGSDWFKSNASRYKGLIKDWE